MTPYSLEQRLAKHREQMHNITKRDGPATSMLLVISDTVETILQHLADVEGDKNIERSHYLDRG